MCPVVYTGGTKTADTHGQAQAVSSFNAATGGFSVQAASTSYVLANGYGSETYNFLAATEAFSKVTPYTIYYHGCADAILVPINDFSITAVLENDGDSLDYDNGALGFVSSDPTNCPIGAGNPNPTSFDFCDYTA